MRKQGYGEPPWRSQEVERAVAEERAAIVAWLRNDGNVLILGTPRRMADAIERGEHAQQGDTKGDQP